MAKKLLISRSFPPNMISTIPTDKVFRCIKDVVDLYYLFQCMPMNTKNAQSAMKKTERHLEDFNGFLN